MENKDIWSPNSWKKHPILQQPQYKDQKELQNVLDQVHKLPSLVSQEEIEILKARLQEVVQEQAFILLIGDCAESFDDCNQEIVEKKIQFQENLRSLLENALNKRIIKIGRIAGQYCKPRSDDFETIDGVKYLTFRGHIINGFDKDEREADPKRIIEAHFRSATTMNCIRSLEFGKIKDQTFTSHEGLLLPYEETQVREIFGKFYNLSAHFLWIGERTRGLDQAHIEFFRGIENPIGVKVSSTASSEDILQLYKKLNPKGELGKFVLIVRLSTKDLVQKLEEMIKTVKDNKLKVIWMCDPVHANTFKAGQFKTRKVDDIIDQIQAVYQTLKKHDLYLGGIHLETTPLDVTECVGGTSKAVKEEDLGRKYETLCDPRLNLNQTEDVLNAFIKCVKGSSSS